MLSAAAVSSVWSAWHDVTGVLVDLTILSAGIAAVVKFRLFNLLGYKWHSAVECKHYSLPDGTVIFTADYTVSNTGQRPLELRQVSLRVVGALQDGALLAPDDSNVIAERVITPQDPGLKGLFQIEAGERTIFTIRTRLDSIPAAMFVICVLDPKVKRPFTIFRSFYCPYAAGSPVPPAASSARP